MVPQHTPVAVSRSADAIYLCLSCTRRALDVWSLFRCPWLILRVRLNSLWLDLHNIYSVSQNVYSRCSSISGCNLPAWLVWLTELSVSLFSFHNSHLKAGKYRTLVPWLIHQVATLRIVLVIFLEGYRMLCPTSSQAGWPGLEIMCLPYSAGPINSFLFLYPLKKTQQ